MLSDGSLSSALSSLALNTFLRIFRHLGLYCSLTRRLHLIWFTPDSRNHQFPRFFPFNLNYFPFFFLYKYIFWARIAFGQKKPRRETKTIKTRQNRSFWLIFLNEQKQSQHSGVSFGRANADSGQKPRLSRREKGQPHLTRIEDSVANEKSEPAGPSAMRRMVMEHA